MLQFFQPTVPVKYRTTIKQPKPWETRGSQFTMTQCPKLQKREWGPRPGVRKLFRQEVVYPVRYPPWVLRKERKKTRQTHEQRGAIASISWSNAAIPAAAS